MNSRIYLWWLWLRRDLHSRYAGSVLGLLWALLLPLLTVAIFYLVFAQIMRLRIPELATADDQGYFLFLLAGLLPWLSIADGLSRAVGSLIAHEQFLQRIAFPVDLIPATVLLTSLLPQLIGTVILLLVLGWNGLLTANALYLPLLFGLQLAMTYGLGLVLALMAVFMRDVAQMTPVVLQLLFYAAPILYPMSFVPVAYHGLFWLNPFAGLINGYQTALIGLPISTETIVVTVIWGAVLGVGGVMLFRALKPGLGDYL